VRSLPHAYTPIYIYTCTLIAHKHCIYIYPQQQQQQQQQQQRQKLAEESKKHYAKMQQMQHTVPEAKKRKVADAEGIAASDPAHGHSLAAMSHQYQQQKHQQQQQQQQQQVYDYVSMHHINWGEICS